MESMEAQSPAFQSPSRSSQQLHFYLAVDRPLFKMETVVELLGVLGRRPWLPIVVCCSSRDELDAVSSSLSTLPYISFAALYSDLGERERASVLDKFRQATINWNQQLNSAVVEEGLEESETREEEDEKKSHLVVVTDVCLPMLSSGESSLSSRVLINYELPTKKETYTRRLTSCLASGGIVINMVVGGGVTTLRSLEESSGIIIAEMPINISEIL
ncbi:hypothetical protein HID58_030194 [Brassica napus]|uniref:Eukaryotic initiation factor 4a n=1 Tax=Brassica napus TaxID=3708 RepID=A0ABQ8CF93_BRANA|nr:eukaryotic initiation factor 4A-I [Brassica napus]KAH0915748.1 hypothetical protein HID58_030194 [Brassica napus]